MADSTKELSIIITARDEATRTIEGISSSFGDLVKSAQAGSFIFAGALTLVGKSIIDVSSELEQAKVSFTVFEGSASAASKTLKELSDFAKVTPFTFPTVVEAAKRLLAYNVEAKDLIPTLKTLGDISAGVGTDKLPQLILAYGQVKAQTRLAGQELRQFTETGVPLLQVLADQMNKNGGVVRQMGASHKAAKVDVVELNDKLAIAKQRVTELSSAHNVHKSTMMAAQNTVQNLSQKIAGATTVTAGFSKQVKVTAKDVMEMIHNKEITFEQVDAALKSMTENGGKFFNLMDKQSHTFSGTMSNISDQLVRVALNIGGISTKAEDFGTVIKGGAFDILEQGAMAALNALNALEPKVKGIIDAFLQNQVAIGIVIGALVGGLLAAGVAIATLFAPAICFHGIICSSWGGNSICFYYLESILSPLPIRIHLPCNTDCIGCCSCFPCLGRGSYIIGHCNGYCSWPGIINCCGSIRRGSRISSCLENQLFKYSRNNQSIR
jgi:tape measure domain-containing protein